MLRRNLMWLLVAAALLLWQSTPAMASVITYDNYADWLAATDVTHTEDFGTDAGTTTWNPNTITIGDLTFGSGSTAGGYVWVIQPAWNLWGTGGSLLRGNEAPLSPIEVAIALGVYSFSTDLMIDAVNASFTVDVYDGTTLVASQQVATNAPYTPTFFGLTSDASFNRVVFTPTQSNALLDNFSYGTLKTTSGGDDPPIGGAETPELATSLMLACGLALIASRRIRLAQ